VISARHAAIALLAVVAVHPAAWAGQAAGSGAPLAVVTTSTDLRALVEAVGGRRVQVESLAPPLADPHAVEVKPGQLARLKAASLLVRIGLDHEPWLGRVLRTLGDERWRPGSQHYLDVSQGITLLQAETPRVREERGPHVHGFGNTHYWLDPENARPMTQAILEALAGVSPADRAAFEANRAGFLKALDAGLTRWHAALAPYRGGRVVVVHETWPYFAQRFGLVVVAALEPTPGVPATPSHLATLIQQMRHSGVKVLIAEPYANAGVVRQVAGKSGARVATLVPSVGGDPEAKDYLALFDLNVKRLTEAFAAAKSQ
jgi:ABC-type Zn uptake system ZnuABC Zn-binding protein ZnuA